MDYVGLKAEIAKPEYNGLGDQATADLVNTKTANVTVDVPGRSIKWLLYAVGKWGNVQRRADTPQPGTDATIAFARFVVDLSRNGDSIPATIGAVATQFAADLSLLVTATDITAGNRTAIIALATGTKPLIFSADGAIVKATDIPIAKAS